MHVIHYYNSHLVDVRFLFSCFYKRFRLGLLAFSGWMRWTNKRPHCSQSERAQNMATPRELSPEIEDSAISLSSDGNVAVSCPRSPIIAHQGKWKLIEWYYVMKKNLFNNCATIWSITLPQCREMLYCGAFKVFDNCLFSVWKWEFCILWSQKSI